MARKIFTDPALYVLVLFNVYCIYEYKQNPGSYVTLVWIFWCQSVLIGIFNFAELLTTKNVDAQGFTINKQPVDPQKGRGCYASFFLFHYGAFHVAYLVFIIVRTGLKGIDPMLFKFSLLLLFVAQTVTFFQHKQRYKNTPPNLGFLFFAPYLRVIPMHLMILGPAFLKIEPAVTFLVLKTAMDVVGYLLTVKMRTQNPVPSLPI
ncbi:MAG TPA: DUF6498-containing protein [Flavisolibacter sp.]|nr:DUF6498-containing protein [Flavisolibacter sp.]